MYPAFAFELGQKVKLKFSEERGEVVSRAESTEYPIAYFVRYLAADGRQIEEWLHESAIEKA